MSYIDQTLLADERVVYRTALHWIIFAQGVVVLLIGLVVLVAFSNVPVAGLAVLSGCAGEAPAADRPIVKGGSDENGEYLAEAGWWKAAPDHTGAAECEANPDTCWTWGEVSGVVVDNPERILVAIWGDRNAAGEERPFDDYRADWSA